MVFVCMCACICVHVCVFVWGDVCLLVRIHTCHHALITHLGEGVAYKEAHTYVCIHSGPHTVGGEGGWGRSKLDSFLKLLIWDQRSQLGQGCACMSVSSCLVFKPIYIYTHSRYLPICTSTHCTNRGC